MAENKHLDIFRYVVAGGLSYFIEVILLLFLSRTLDIGLGLSVSIAFWFGIITSFLLQKIIGFKNYRKEVSAISKQFSLFLLLVFINYLFTLFITTSINSDYIVFSRTLAISIVTVWNYLILKKIFNNKESTKITSKSFTSVWRILLKNKENILIIIGSTLFITAFFWQYVGTGPNLIGGDFDYYAQMYEAFRISVLKYGQFPLWNPWMSGGLPLFTNPQFGLISIQSLFVLVFGTIYGLKLAYVTYAIIGFWGMYFISRHLESSKIRALLIGFIWVFGGFFAGHSISHFTFALFFLFPWIIYLFLNWKRRFAWLWLGILFSLIVLSAFHYGFLMTAMASVIFTGSWVSLLLVSKSRYKKRELFNYLTFLFKTATVFTLLAGYRVITTIIFVDSNSRPASILSEMPPGLTVTLKALFLPIGTLINIPEGLQWGWGEYSAYLGIGTTTAFLLSLLFLLTRLKNLAMSSKTKFLFFTIVTLGIISFLLALGDFHMISPYNLLTQMPGLSQTRVSSRWLIFVNFSILFILAGIKRYPKVLNFLLAVAVIELFIAYGPINRPGTSQVSVPSPDNVPTVIMQYDTKQMVRTEVQQNLDYSYFYSTKRNLGQIYADDSIINTLNQVLGTSRCGENINPECDLVQSDNANVQYWSPNYIQLVRTGSGPIKMNMNVSSGWQINENYIFMNNQQLNPETNFFIPDDGSQVYEIRYAPKLSPEWFGWKLQQIH